MLDGSRMPTPRSQPKSSNSPWARTCKTSLRTPCSQLTTRIGYYLHDNKLVASHRRHSLVTPTLRRKLCPMTLRLLLATDLMTATSLTAATSLPTSSLSSASMIATGLLALSLASSILISTSLPSMIVITVRTGRTNLLVPIRVRIINWSSIVLAQRRTSPYSHLVHLFSASCSRMKAST
ncbi:uncharacterized protein B0I36DRAFT_342287 [Microdochium trichocladiopsis]|uniref:Uncharacterized protein n=1 Tax=Microdochium trichocladiopsis TaxID=1682393 RepID=A0A9P9BH74_9PEZI|nr:uncharacterized protein B0I36DRAFT_342287 [Microdochium trichocladiopsis]KAH7009407.1 hypothetical protein B0I36DRAFT_342287 [Microdochium trichocladiopsis]